MLPVAAATDSRRSNGNTPPHLDGHLLGQWLRHASTVQLDSHARGCNAASSADTQGCVCVIGGVLATKQITDRRFACCKQIGMQWLRLDQERRRTAWHSARGGQYADGLLSIINPRSGSRIVRLATGTVQRPSCMQKCMHARMHNELLVFQFLEQSVA